MSTNIIVQLEEFCPVTQIWFIRVSFDAGQVWWRYSDAVCLARDLKAGYPASYT